MRPSPSTRAQNLEKLRQCREKELKLSAEKAAATAKTPPRPKRQAPPTPVRTSPRPPTSQWWRYLDSSTGQHYYYDAVSGVTSWLEPPATWRDATSSRSPAVQSRTVISTQTPASVLDAVSPQDWLLSLSNKLEGPSKLTPQPQGSRSLPPGGFVEAPLPQSPSPDKDTSQAPFHSPRGVGARPPTLPLLSPIDTSRLTPRIHGVSVATPLDSPSAGSATSSSVIALPLVNGPADVGYSYGYRTGLDFNYSRPDNPSPPHTALSASDNVAAAAATDLHALHSLKQELDKQGVAELSAGALRAFEAFAFSSAAAALQPTSPPATLSPSLSPTAAAAAAVKQQQQQQQLLSNQRRFEHGEKEAEASAAVAEAGVRDVTFLAYTLNMLDGSTLSSSHRRNERERFWPRGGGDEGDSLVELYCRRVLRSTPLVMHNKCARRLQSWWRCIRAQRSGDVHVNRIVVAFISWAHGKQREPSSELERVAFAKAVSAACNIQRVWRGCATRKHTRPLLLARTHARTQPTVVIPALTADDVAASTSTPTPAHDGDEQKLSARHTRFAAGKKLERLMEQENARKAEAKRQADERRKAIHALQVRRNIGATALQCLWRFTLLRRRLAEAHLMASEDALAHAVRKHECGRAIASFLSSRYAGWVKYRGKMAGVVALALQAAYRGRRVRKDIATVQQIELRKNFAIPTQANLERVFRYVSNNRGGKISISEFTAAIRKAAIAAAELTKSPFQQIQLFSRMERDGEGMVDLNSFLRSLENTTDPIFLEWMEKLLLKLHAAESGKSFKNLRITTDTRRVTRQATSFFRMADVEKTGRLMLPHFLNLLRKGPSQLHLTTDFDQQTALFERIAKKAGGEPLTLDSFVNAVVAMEHLEFGVWLSHVFSGLGAMASRA